MQPSERESAALTSPHTDTANSSLSVDSGGRTVHPVVARVLAVTPIDSEGLIIVRFHEIAALDGGQLPEFGDPEPVAARQAAAVLRWLAEWIREQDREGQCRCYGCINDIADELDPKETSP